jgi:ABC-2 type transport system ATP-binding protein
MANEKRLTDGDAVIETKRLSKRYGRCLALNDVTLSVKKGQLIGLVGKNGAGKTTLIRLLTGVAHPTSGTISLFGSQNGKELEASLSRVAAMVEQPALYENMTTTQNLMTECILNGVKDPIKSGYIQDKLNFVGLPESFTDKRHVKDYSLGMRQRVGIAMAMIGDPELMILDEPTNGLDPEGIRQIRELLLKLNKQGITIIVSSHILSELSKFASTYVFIDKGCLVEEISAADLEKKVGKIIIVKTSDNEKAQKVLLEAKFDSEIVKDTLNVHNIKEPAEVINVLNDNGVSLLGLREEENSLEDYFVDVIGGNKR